MPSSTIKLMPELRKELKLIIAEKGLKSYTAAMSYLIEVYKRCNCGLNAEHITHNAKRTEDKPADTTGESTGSIGSAPTDTAASAPADTPTSYSPPTL